MSKTQRIGQFELQDILGSGGIGHVHAAIDSVLGREVAIKSLRPELLSDTAFLDRFRAEAINLARLNHPNIATLYSLMEEGGNLFMVMELVRGKSLETIVEERKGPIGIQQSTAIIAQAADGLAYAHEMGIVHRDIKPANLMVTEGGRIKVMDFGIARMKGSQRLTRDGSIVGTLAYISPEQLKGKEGDQRSDLYSLAIVFYELLTGKVPFTAETDYDLIQAHVTKAPPRLVSLVPDVPPAIEAAIMKALSKKPEARFASVAEFAHALGAPEIRLNAASIIGSPAALIEKTAQNAPKKSTQRQSGAFTQIKQTFLGMPMEWRGIVIGAISAVVLGGAVVAPLLIEQSAPVTTTKAPDIIPSLPLPQPIVVQIPQAVATPVVPNSVVSPPVVSPPAAPSSAPVLPAPNALLPVAPSAMPLPAGSALVAEPSPAINATTGVSVQEPAPKTPPKPTLDHLKRAVSSQDFGTAFAMAKPLAEAGDAEAQFILGNLFRAGRGTRQSHIEAGLWFERASDQNHAKAANNLAYLYEENLLSPDRKSNQAKAEQYFIKSAELGFAHAQFKVGAYLEKAPGNARKNKEAAIEFYQKAANQDDEDALLRLKQLGFERIR